MTTQSRIQEIAERCEKATPGPWFEMDGERVLICLSDLPPGACGQIAEVGDPGSKEFLSGQTKRTQENAVFIAHARTDIPFLLEQLTKAVEVIEFAEMTLSHAVALDYLGEGSTQGMAKDAIKKCEDFLKEMRSDG